MKIDLTEDDLDFIVEALQARASRHESMGRANPRSAGPHDRAAASMRKLAGKLMFLEEQGANHD